LSRSAYILRRFASIVHFMDDTPVSRTGRQAAHRAARTLERLLAVAEAGSLW
jgi:hypothetical protein